MDIRSIQSVIVFIYGKNNRAISLHGADLKCEGLIWKMTESSTHHGKSELANL